MGDLKDAPIRSALAYDPDFEERIDVFIVGLGEQIDAIQEADRIGDLASGAAMAQKLAGQAEQLGFPPLAEAAQEVAAACQEGDPHATHDRIVELTGIVYRVRRGHRGAF